MPLGSRQFTIIRSNERLCKTHDGALQGSFTVLVGGETRDGPGELNNLHVFFQIALETGVKDLALSGLQAIDNRGDRPHVVCHAERVSILC